MAKEKLMEENNWQQRTELLLGKEKMNRIRNSHVLVVGLGGVGAYAAEMICRAGDDDCRCRYSAAYQYEQAIACHAFYIRKDKSRSAGCPV